MKILITLFFASFSAYANIWTYQVNVNSSNGTVKNIDAGKNTFEAGPYYCEVSPVTVKNNTEYRSLACSVGVETVSTGGLRTRKNTKFPSVQYAILNLNGTKNLVNIVVACQFN